MGLHDTLEKVLSLYEAMAGTADRAVKRVFTGWVGEIDIELVGRVSLLSLLPVADLGESYNRLQNEAKVVELWSLPGL